MKKKIMLVSMLSLSLVLAACGSKEEEPKVDGKKTEEVAPKKKEEAVKVEGVQYVNTAFLDNLLSNTSFTDKTRKTYSDHIAGWTFYLIDVREESKYNDGHINGANNIPVGNLKNGSELLPSNKETQIILYAEDAKDKTANEAAKSLKEQGYKNIVVYQDGVSGWAGASYLIVTDVYVNELISNEKKKDAYLLINALPATAFNSGHIPTSVNAEDTYFEEKHMGILPENKDFDIVIYCMGFECGKSHNVAELLVSKGYTNVKVYAAGMLLWNEKGLPVEKGNVDIGELANSSRVDPGDFINNAEKENTLYIDARDVSEYSLGNVKGSINVPFGNYEAELSKIAKDDSKQIYVYSNQGERAEKLAKALTDKGYKNVKFLKDKITIHDNGTFTIGK